MRSALSNREKTIRINALRNLHKVPELLARLRLARSSCFYHRTRIALEDKYLPVRRAMADIFAKNHRCYDHRRLRASLTRQSISLSEKVVQRLRKQEALAIKPKRRRYGSYLGEVTPAPQNIINRDFHATAPHKKGLTDITEFHIRAGKVYLSPIIDCFDGLVISWAIGSKPDADVANTMPDAPIKTIVDRGAQPLLYSHRGAHYLGPGWLERVSEAKLVRSLSRSPFARQCGLRRLLRAPEDGVLLSSGLAEMQG